MLGLTELSVALMVGVPAVVELVTTAVYVPSPLSDTEPICSLGSLELNATTSPTTELLPASVTVAVAVTVEEPSAMTVVGDKATCTFAARLLACEGATTATQLMAVRTAVNTSMRQLGPTGRRRRSRRTSFVIERNLRPPRCEKKTYTRPTTGPRPSFRRGRGMSAWGRSEPQATR